MGVEDVPDVMAVEERAYPSPWTEGIFRDCILVGYQCWVVRDGPGVVGYAVLSAAAGEAHLLNICVAPEYQGRGIGRRLLEAMMEQARRYKADTVFLEVRPSNSPALTLYRTAGFAQVGYRKEYYPDEGQREDAIVMAREL